MKQLLEKLTEDLFKPYSMDEFIANKLKAAKCVLNSEGKWDCPGNIDLSDLGLRKIPVQFGEVSGDFICSYNKLTSLQGAPSKVSGVFFCNSNKLTSLQGAPSEVSGDFYCNNNNLTSLQGAPSKVSGDFHCSNNKLTSLKGIGKVKGKIYKKCNSC